MATVEDSTSVGGAAHGAAFVRKSSGLIKTGTPWRIFVMSGCTPGRWRVHGHVLSLYGVGAFPRTNLILSLPDHDEAAWSAFNLGVYAFLATARIRAPAASTCS